MHGNLYLILSEHLNSDEAKQATRAVFSVYSVAGPVHSHIAGYALSNSSILSEVNDGKWRVKPTPSKDRKHVLFPAHFSEEIVVIGEFSSAPQQRSIERVDKLLRKYADAAINEYRAKHDYLTDLPNRSGFEEKIEEFLFDFGGFEEIAEEINANVDQVLDSSEVCVLALDIDHFKQVNDTYGHPFGDAVLKSFARRIDEVANTIKVISKCDCIVARVGGEEFLVALKGNINRDSAHDFAEQIRRAVSASPLPSDSEMLQSSFASYVAGNTTIRSSERIRTVSIGLAFLSDVLDYTDNEDNGKELVRLADLALYRAKANGRDTSIAYSDIRRQYGRVLEHHESSGIVAIDIGSSVGVKNGHEFNVFHPTFSGKIPFVFDDGRTRKRLGMYPKLVFASVVVFNAQEEMSFCRIETMNGQGAIPINSRIEEIPLGTIRSSLHRGSFGAGADAISVPDSNDLETSLLALGALSEPPAAIVFELRNAQEVQNKRGVSGVNLALSQLYLSIQETWPRAHSIGQLDINKIAVLLSATSNGLKSEISGALALASDRTRDECRFSVGAFDKSIYEEANKKKNSIAENIDPKGVLDLAQFALKTASEDKPTVYFSHEIARTAMTQARSDADREGFVKDYDLIYSYGIRYALLDNIAGVNASIIGRLQKAHECYSRAIDIDSTDKVFYVNRAWIHQRLRQHPESLADIAAAKKLESISKWPAQTAFNCARVEYFAWKADHQYISAEAVLADIEIALTKLQNSEDNNLRQMLTRMHQEVSATEGI